MTFVSSTSDPARPASGRLLTSLTVFAAVANGVVAGVFFTFDSFVMPALAQLPVAGGVAAMQSINVVVLNSTFLMLFVLATLASGALMLTLVFKRRRGAWLLAVSGLVSVIGSFGVTMMLNVPLNDALMATPASGAEAAGMWTRYLAEWGLWNLVRTLASAAAAVGMTLSLLVRRSGQ